ncbi:GNAT family N-acetyltransferase [Opitutus sp. ER46]|uniref:GNAT family N-acetyltransferase n=1 Tax=Opitutus sp. ER46 TaxID=2161864 RepID=UPI000D317F1F|nr:GNAT family N-acetyltransferase [Opitutus sp. ER46]PTX90775.1 GNAT family N-acetyltransferase [Opitutus sp. ER46]
MNPKDQPPIKIEHNEAGHRFETTVDGHLCVADYDRRDGEIVFTHTYVPPELRGRGIAEQLVRTALEHARDEGLRVVPECSYVAVFLQRHQEYAALLS